MTGPIIIGTSNQELAAINSDFGMDRNNSSRPTEIIISAAEPPAASDRSRASADWSKIRTATRTRSLKITQWPDEKSPASRNDRQVDRWQE